MRIYFNIVLFIWIVSIPMKNAIYQISTALLILIFIMDIYKNRDYIIIKNILSKIKQPFYIFILILSSMFISNLFNDIVKEEAWRIFIMYFIRYALVFFILLYFYSKNFFTVKKLLIFILISLSIEVFYAVYESLFLKEIFSQKVKSSDTSFISSSGRLYAFTFHPNNLGYFIGIFILIITSILKEQFKSKYTQKFLIFILLLSFYVLLFTYSRASWVSLFIASLFYMSLYYKSFKLKHFVLFLVISIFIFFIVINVDILQSRIFSIFEGNSSGRTSLIWLPAIELIKDKFLIGHGLGIETVNFYNKEIHDLGGFHNVTLEILYSIGIFGFIPFCLLLFFVIKEIIKNKDIALFMILIFILVDSQFDQSIFMGKPYLSALTIFMFFVFRNRVEELRSKLS